MSVTVNGTSGLVFGDGTIQGTAAGNGFRNRIINGDFRIDQRMNGTAQTGVSGGSTYFLADRYRIGGNTLSSGRFTFQRVADAPSNFRFSGKITVSTVQSTALAAGDIQVLSHIIEGNNLLDLGWGTAAAKPVTISFWVKASVTGIYDLAVRSDRSGSYMTYLAPYTVSASNTWEYKTITIAGPTTGTWYDDPTNLGIRLDFNLGTGSTLTTSSTNQWLSGDFFKSTTGVNLVYSAGATWQITGVQFEIGGAATQFEYRPHSVELALCQRYYVNLMNNSHANPMYIGMMGGNANAWCYHDIFLPVPMRTTPSPSWTRTLVNIGASGVYGRSANRIEVQGQLSSTTNDSYLYTTVLDASAEL